MKRIPLLVKTLTTVFLFSLYTSPLAATDSWQTYKGVTVWTQYSNKDRTFSWSGTTDAEGRAKGPGTYIVYFKGKKVVSYTGTMEAGRLTDRVTAVYHLSSQTYVGEIRDNSENGFGTMKYADGTERTGRWVDGKLVEPATDSVVANPTPSIARASNGDGPVTDSTATPKPVPTVRATLPADVVSLAPGIGFPSADASAAEQFVYQLSVITRRYIMEAAYHPTPDESYKDAYFAKERAIAVARLLDSPLAKEVPESLSKFCLEALTLDAALQTIAQHRDQTAQRSRDEGMGLIDKIVGGLPGTMFHGSNESNSVEGSALDIITDTFRRVQEPETMLGQFREYKASLDLHRRWATLLRSLAADDAGLLPYAADPRVSDPSWHFMHNQAGGDVFFGHSRDLSRVTRRAGGALPQIDIGDVTGGPVRVHFKFHGDQVGCSVKYRGTKYGEVFVAHCRRGHFLMWDGMWSAAWVARGLRDSQCNGQYRYDNTIAGSPVTYSIGLCHMSTTGEGEDLDADGDVLIYLEYQYSSEAEAARHARDVYLR